MACVSGTFVRTAAVIGLPLARLRAAIPEEILGGPPAHHVTGRRVLSAVYLKDAGHSKEARAWSDLPLSALRSLPSRFLPSRLPASRACWQLGGQC